MPQFSEISSSMVPGAESPETSLQVSSTSPEICDEPSRSKALSVRKIGKPASRSSSSSSRASLPPSGVQGGSSTGDASHRGLGSFPKSVSMNRMDVQMDVQMEGDNFDQRSEHVEQTYHDHRTQQQLNVLSVGVNPAVAHARESQVRAEACNAVAQYHHQSQEAQRVAEVSVMGAEHRVSQIHSEASAHVAQLNQQAPSPRLLEPWEVM